jgi:group I intron endonuclease
MSVLTDMRENKFLIYALADPDSKKIRYIGKSSSGMKRPNSHWANCSLRNDHNPYKNRWILKLKKRGLKFLIFVLEEISSGDFEGLKNAEVKWIKYGRDNGWPLTNLTDGGDGVHGYVHSEETKKKISTSNTGKISCMLGKHHTEDSKKKISESNKGKISSLRGIKRSEEFKEKLRIANKGKAPSPRTLEASRIAHTGKKLSPEHKSKLIAGMRKYKHGMEQKLKIASARGARPFFDPDGERHLLLSTAADKYGVTRCSIRAYLTGRCKSKLGDFKYEL